MFYDSVAAPALTLQVTGLNNGQSYSITVKARNANGVDSAASSPMSGTPNAPVVPVGGANRPFHPCNFFHPWLGWN